MMLKQQLFTYDRTFITLSQLEARSTAATYAQFAKEVCELEREGMLSGVVSAG